MLELARCLRFPTLLEASLFSMSSKLHEDSNFVGMLLELVVAVVVLLCTFSARVNTRKSSSELIAARLVRFFAMWQVGQTNKCNMLLLLVGWVAREVV